MELTGWETGLVYAFSAWAIGCAVFVVAARSLVHSATALVSCLVSVAALFLVLHAEFLAGVQVLVYAGGVMTLFLFAIAFVGVGRAVEDRRFNRQTGAALLCAGLLAVAFAFAASEAGPWFSAGAGVRHADPGAAPAVSHDTEEVASDLYLRAALPFEIVSLLLLVALVGAVLLTGDRREEPESGAGGAGAAR